MNNNLSRYILGAFLLLLCLYANAQEPGMWQITDDDGLPSNTVYHTAQDQKGFIWIGTEKGICRFDGKNFKPYKSDELNDNEILKIDIDSLDRVWFQNLSGQLFYIENENIYNAQNLFPSELSNVSDFAVDGFTVWITFQSESKELFEYFNAKITSNQYHLARLSFDNKNSIFNPLYIFNQTFSEVWGFRKSDHSVYLSSQLYESRLSNNSMLIQLNKESNDLNVKSTFTNDNKTTSITYYLLKKELYLLFFKIREALIFKSIGNKNEKLLSLKKSINDLHIFDEKFWILTSEGIIIKNILSDQEKETTYLLKNKNTNRLMVDHEGNKWIATTGTGIYVITAPQTQVIQTNNFNLPNNEITSLTYDHSKKKLLVGHAKGQISIIDTNFENQIITSDPSGRIIDILVDHSGNYWFVNEKEMVAFSPDLTIKKQLWGGVKTLLQAKNGDFWLGMFRYTLRGSKENIKFVNIKLQNRLLERILFNRTYALYQDYKDDIWIGSTNGLYIFQDTIHAFLEKGEHKPYNISSITQSKDSVIWVATRGNGLLAIKDNKIIQKIKEENGLASNTVKKLFASPHHLWAATDNGVNKIDLKSKETGWISSTNGLPSNDVNDIIVVDKQVWIATSKGLANFSVDAQHKNNTPPPIYISNIKIAEKDTILHDSYSLSYDQNNLQIDMIGLGYKAKGEINYEYKLSGLENDWVQTSSQFARYPNLPPGEYRFDVFAINEDQVKSSEPASVYFYIRPPLWEAWWFRFLSFLSIGGAIAYFVNARFKRQQQEQYFLAHVKELKTMALRSQMNPHFIFNALNAIQKFLTTNDREQAINYLSNFGKLIRLVFDQSQHEKISLEEELDFLKLYLDLEKLRFMDAIDIQLEVSPFLQEHSDEIHLPPLLIQPIVENSFKHGFLYKKEQGILSINFSRKDAFLICEIEDNGIGRKKAEELGQKSSKDRPSSGLKTSKERLNILRLNTGLDTTNIEKSELNFIDLYDTDGNVKGTLVKIKIYCLELEDIK